MENRSHALIAGLFTLVLGIALAATAWWFTRSDESSMVSYLVTTTGNVAGLKAEAPVRYRGVEVGKVRSVRLSPDRPGTIEIRIVVDEHTPVNASTYAQLGYLGVTGLAFVALSDDGKASAPGEGPTVSVIPMRPSILDSGENLLASVSTVVERVGELLDEDMQKSLRRTLAHIERTTDRTAALAARLEKDVQALPAVMADTRTTLRDANVALNEAKGAFAEAKGALSAAQGTLARTDGLIAVLGGTAAKVDSSLAAMSTLAATAEDFGIVARSLQGETLPRVNLLADELARETRALDRLLQTLSEQPHSVVFGPQGSRPGPGEPGFIEVLEKR